MNFSAPTLTSATQGRPEAQISEEYLDKLFAEADLSYLGNL